MGFGEAEVGEGGELVENAFGDGMFDAVLHHTVDQFFGDTLHFLAGPFVAHSAAEFVGFGRCKAGGSDGDAHPLFLEEGYTEGALEDRLEAGMRIGDRLLTVATSQVRMHHTALDGAGTDEGDLDDEVVEAAWFVARQGVHLGARLDLEDTDRFSGTEQLVDPRIVVRQFGHVDLFPMVLFDQFKSEIDEREHTEAEQIDFDETGILGIVLIPLDDGAIGHGGVFDRDNMGERLLRHDHTADMDTEMARETLDLGAEIGKQLHAVVAEVEVGFAQLGGDFIGVGPVTKEPGDAIDLGRDETEGLADLAHG